MNVPVTITWCIWSPRTGTGKRHHQGPGAGFVPLAGYPAVFYASSGNPFPATAASSVLSDGKSVPLAFMSVVGGAGGSQLFTDPGTQTVIVGSQPISILVVYAPLPTPGGGGGAPAVWVDAFDAESGQLSDNDFVDVYDMTGGSPAQIPNPLLTSTANNDGSVSTAKPEDLRARGAVDSGVPFAYWKKLGGSSSASADFVLQKNDVGIVLAFYQVRMLKMKDLKDHKETVKEFFKEKEVTKDAKDQLDSRVLKRIGDTKGPKELVEVSSIENPLVDPAWLTQIQEQLAVLAAAVDKLSTFITPQQHPAVGEEVTAQAKKTRSKK